MEKLFDRRSLITFGDMLLWQRFFGAFPAFKSRNFQIYFAGQFVSLIGTWMQQVGEAWLVLQITHSALWVGIVIALSELPILFFTLFAGVIVDRFSKKNILLFTQTVSLILALLLGILTLTGTITIMHICLIALVSGIVGALDMPARQAFVVEMVGRDKLTSAIALNATVWNMARIVGPALAGIIIAASGAGSVFVINAISFLAVLIALFFVKTKAPIHYINSHAIEAVKEGLRYAFTHTTIRNLLLFTTISTIFGWSFSAMIPVVVERVYHFGPELLGFFYTALGTGAVLGTIALSALSHKVNPRRLILTGNLTYSTLLIIFSFTHNFFLALILLFFVGFGIMLQFPTTNSSLQHLVPHEIRGRIMSIYTFMFLGMNPIGSFQIGFFAEHLGPLAAIRIGACIVLVTGIIFFFNRQKVQIPLLR